MRQGRERPWQEACGNRRNGGDLDGRAPCGVNAPRTFANRPEAAEEQLRLGEKGHSFFCGGDTGTIAMQQRKTDFALQILNEACHDGLRLAQGLRRTGDAAD